MKTNILLRIIRVTGRTPVECSCPLCKKQCKTPCLGTPQDIWSLIQAGYGDKLKLSIWGVAKMRGEIDFMIPMVQAIQTPNGCIFFENGLCQLHESGLKPTEGKLSYHIPAVTSNIFSKSLTWNVAREWIDPDNIELVTRILFCYLPPTLK